MSNKVECKNACFLFPKYNALCLNSWYSIWWTSRILKLVIVKVIQRQGIEAGNKTQSHW